jgi:hypothetical protein
VCAYSERHDEELVENAVHQIIARNCSTRDRAEILSARLSELITPRYVDIEVCAHGCARE